MTSSQKMLAAGVVIGLIISAGCGSGGDDAVIAKVNRAKITTGDFKRQLEELSPQMQQAVATDAKARRDFLEDLIGIEVALQEAKRLGLHKDQEFKKRQDDRRKVIEQQLADAARNDLFNGLLKKELADAIKPPTDEEVKQYFAKHRDEIRKAAGGKELTFKQAEEKGLRNYIMQVKQRDAYLEYTKSLKAKARVTVDDKALEAALAAPKLEGHAPQLQMQTPPAAEMKDGAGAKHP